MRSNEMLPVWRYKLFYLIIPMYFGVLIGVLNGLENTNNDQQKLPQQPQQFQPQLMHNYKTTTTTITTPDSIIINKPVIIDTFSNPLTSGGGGGGGRALFSPRVDYNEWMPVGHGDPLKKDPTYDYSPPVLDRVRYWGEQNKDKKDILLLGVVSKRQQGNINNNNNHNKNPHRKDLKHNNNNNNNSPIRRNFYMQDLPTVLMPPPMQPPTMNPYVQQYMNNNNQNWQQELATNHNKNNEYPDTIAQDSMISNYVTVHRNNAANQFQPQYPNKQYLNDHNQFENNIPYSDAHLNANAMMINNNQENLSESMNGVVNNYINKKPWIHSLLQKEVTKPSPFVVMAQSPSIFESHSAGFVKNRDKFNLIDSSPSSTYFTPTIRPSASSSSSSSSSSSPYSSFESGSNEWSKDVEPPPPQSDAQFINNNLMAQYTPMYLIIQGHSKVKTYGRFGNDTDKHLPKIVPVMGGDEPIKKHMVSIDDDGNELKVKHLHTKVQKIEDDDQSSSSSSSSSSSMMGQSSSAMDSLLSLLDNSFGDIFGTQNNNNNNNNTKENLIANKADQKRVLKNLTNDKKQ